MAFQQPPSHTKRWVASKFASGVVVTFTGIAIVFFPPWPRFSTLWQLKVKYLRIRCGWMVVWPGLDGEAKPISRSGGHADVAQVASSAGMLTT